MHPKTTCVQGAGDLHQTLLRLARRRPWTALAAVAPAVSRGELSSGHPRAPPCMLWSTASGRRALRPRGVRHTSPHHCACPPSCEQFLVLQRSVSKETHAWFETAAWEALEPPVEACPSNEVNFFCNIGEHRSVSSCAARDRERLLAAERLWR